jgi:hypothetical protein
MKKVFEMMIPKISNRNCHYLRILTVILILFTVSARITAANEPAVSVAELNGHWLIQINEDKKDRILIIESTERENDTNSYTFSGRYSFIENIPKPVNGKASFTDNRWNIFFETPAASHVSAALQTSQQMLGAIYFNKGKHQTLRATKIDLDAYQSFKMIGKSAATNRVAVNKIRPNSTIELVLFSAPNCPHCVGWKFENLLEGKNGLRDSEIWSKIKFTEIHKASYGGTVLASQFPSHLRWLGELLNSERKYQHTLAATPSFVVVVDDIYITRGSGTSAWVSTIKPHLVEFLKQKDSLIKNKAVSGHIREEVVVEHAAKAMK